jgi:Cu/Ag efflux pump CusA
VLGPLVRTPLPAIGAIVAVIAAGALLVPGADKQLLPDLEDSDVMIRWEGPSGTSLPEMERIIGRAAEELRALPGVRNVGAQVGQASLGDAAVGSDSAEMFIRVDDSADYSKTLASVHTVVSGYPGLRKEVTTYSKERMRQVLSGAHDEITVRLFGTDLDMLQSKAQEVRQRLAGIKGVESASLASPPAQPTMEVEVDIDKAREKGVKPGDVRRAAATLLSGLRVGNLFEDQKVFDVVVWGAPATRNSPSSVQNLLVDTPSGVPARLGDIASVRVRSTRPSIEHQDVSRFVDVTADVGHRNLGSVRNDVRAELRHVDFPLEYHAELLDDFARHQDATRRMVAFVVATAIGVLLLLQAAFGSWRLATVTFLLLPVSLAGGALVARIGGGTITLATVGGLLAVLALALRNTIQWADRARRVRRAEGIPVGIDLVRRVASERMWPVVMAALTTTLVLLPLVIIGDVAGQEIVRPMALVVFGGLVTSTVVTLLLLPALYLRFAPRDEPPSLDLETEPDETEPDETEPVQTEPALRATSVGTT